MSDIKQAILDEINEVFIDQSVDDALGDAIEVIEKHLEGMVIVPSEPTSIMLGIGEFFDDDNETVYKAMLDAFKESK